MKKLGRNTLAVGAATLLITSAVSFSANAADEVVAQSRSSAINATGITQLVDTGECVAISTGEGAPTQGEGNCGEGLATQGAVVVDQTASTDLVGDRGTSQAAAAVAPVEIPALTTIDLSTIGADIAPDAVNTGTVLDTILEGLDPVTAPLFEALLTPLLGAIQSAALDPVLAGLQGQLPVSVRIGAVTSECSAIEGGDALGDSTVAGIDLVVGLPGGEEIVLPFDLDTAPNSALVGPAVQDLVDGVLEGLEASLNQSLSGVLGPLAELVGTVQQQLVTPILDALETSLLNQLGEALAPVITGTVNKQTTADDGESIEVTALDLDILGGQAASAQLARVSCGPNGLAVPNDDDDAQADGTDADGTDADGTDADGTDADAVADADADAQADSAADADAQADADVTTALPAAGAPNLLPFWMLGLGLMLFGAAVLVNERRRMITTA